MLDEYRRCAATCAAIDYSDMRTVEANNQAADRMYELVRSAASAGPAAVQELAGLLDEPECAPWIAHQLLECCRVSPEIEGRCLRIIEGLAESSLGEQMWLQDYPRRGTL